MLTPRMTQTRRPSISPNCATSLRVGLIDCIAKGALHDVLDGFSAHEIQAILNLWDIRARREQLPPRRANWRAWLFVGGRGAGKTRAGAEWVRGLACGFRDFSRKPVGRIALVGEIWADARDVMVEGVSGLLAIHCRADRPAWEIGRRRLVWPNGAVAQVFSADDPESLRGPQFGAAWCDELAKWRRAQETWDMLQFGLRLGDWPRLLVTTTPRPLPLLKRLMSDPKNVVTRAATRRNAANLAPAFLAAIEEKYGGTRLGRQEMDGEMIEDHANALWTRAMIEACRGERPARLLQIVVAIDPPAASHARADSCGIVAAGIDEAGIIHVLADETCSAARPRQWAQTALALYHRLEADALVAEVNQGGDMVAAVITEADPSVPVTQVRASRGKFLRATPVALLYEQHRVKHCGTFPQLEDEMCAFSVEGMPGGASPDRLDALVWAVTQLALLPKRAEPRMRRM
jgi:phage terminase large subunit-like protein